MIRQKKRKTIKLSEIEIKTIFGFVISFIGCILIVFTLGWIPLLGLFLIIWGNNINLRDDFNKKLKIILEVIKK